VRRQPDLDRPTVMMLTSADGLGDADRCRKLGMAAYLIKPVRSGELQAAIVAAMQGVSSGAGPAPAPSTPRKSPPPETPALTRPLRILLAEDNVVNKHVARQILGKDGHAATAVDNGKKA